MSHEHNVFAPPEGFSGTIVGPDDLSANDVMPSGLAESTPGTPAEFRTSATVPTTDELARNDFKPDLERFQTDDAYAISMNEALLGAAVAYAGSRYGRANHYTEVHQVGDHFLIIPDVRDDHRHLATIGGNHSMLDGGDIKLGEYATVVGSEEKLRQTFGLSTDSLRAKGRLSSRHGVLSLEIGDTRRGDPAQPYEWVYAFKEQAHQQPLFHVDQKRDAKVVTFDVPLFNPLGHIEVQRFDTVAGHSNPSVSSGFLDGVDPASVHYHGLKLDHKAGLERSGEMTFLAKEADTGRHLELYEAAGRTPGLHYFTVGFDGYAQRLACQYTEDLADNSTNVAVIYQQPAEGDRHFAELRALLVDAFAHQNQAPGHKLKFHETFVDADGHYGKTIATILVDGEAISSQITG